jgi:iron-sulfur cluster repair protein YtfE (RIC family)
MTAPRSASSSHAAPRRRTAAEPDAIKLLKDDHAQVKKLFAQYEKLAKAHADSSSREALALDICDKLSVHTTIEEEIFYPAAREALGEEKDDLVDEATVEHGSAKDLIALLQSSDPNGDLYDARVKVLGEYIDHHVNEEQTEMFPKVKGKIDAKAVGMQLQRRKEQLMARPH